MSNSRSERRRQSRGGSTPPPRRRNPMLLLYIFGGIVALVIVAAVFFVKWQQTTADADVHATPTPNAAAQYDPTKKPIQLADGVTLGVPMIQGGIAKQLPDTRNGGLGPPVDGMTCGGMEYQTLHIHVHLAIFYHGKQVQVPAHIGFAPVNGQVCLYWTHTHAPDGIIHVESPMLAPPGSAGFNLGMVFDVWGQPLTRDDVAGLKGPVICYVNGMPYDSDLRLIPLTERKQIVLEIGTPTVAPPDYLFPPLD